MQLLCIKNIYSIGGYNGAGKTTASYTVLPDILDCKEQVNAYEIAKGLSPFQPETVSSEAGRIMLTRIQSRLNDSKSFAFKTTLVIKSCPTKIKMVKEAGYKVVLIFWINPVKLAKERVRTRVVGGTQYS